MVPEDDLWWRHHVRRFTLLSVPRLSPGVKCAASFESVCVNVPQHLRYLLAEFKAAGGKVLRSHLPNEGDFVRALETAARIASDKSDQTISDIPIFVNASGIGSRFLVGDEAVFPTKGQTILVKGESAFAKTTDGNFYVIPRPWSGTTILGGTREVGQW